MTPKWILKIIYILHSVQRTHLPPRVENPHWSLMPVTGAVFTLGTESGITWPHKLFQWDFCLDSSFSNSRASLVAQLVEDLLTMWETWVRSLGWEDPLENESLSVVSDSLVSNGLHSTWNSPGQNTGVDSRSLFQGIFPNPGIEPRFPALQAVSLPAEPQGIISLVPPVPCWKPFHHS